MSARIILARHGETKLNVERRFRGRADPELSENGREQVQRLGEALTTTTPVTVVASPRRRARETAAAIGQSSGVAVHVDERLDDVDYGQWTGRTHQEAEAGWSDLYASFRNDPGAVRFPDGESVRDLVDRTYDVMTASADSERTTILVTHDIVIRVLICSILGSPLKAMHQLRIDTASSTGIWLASDGPPRLDWMNETCHLQFAHNNEA